MRKENAFLKALVISLQQAVKFKAAQNKDVNVYQCLSV